MSGEPHKVQGMSVLGLAACATTFQLALVWCFQFFPSVDGPAHVHLAHAFMEALRGDDFYGKLVDRD
jgi:hypothetical protein